LAGVPRSVVERARAVLADLETGDGPLPSGAVTDPAQLSLFAPPQDRVAEQLATLDLDRITPLDALALLARLVETVRGPR
jgi:DNA mismatch repair protein MutS